MALTSSTPPPSLREFQHRMSLTLRHPMGVTEDESAGTLNCLRAPPAGRKVDRLSIYAEAYHLRLAAALRETYPLTEKWLCHRWGDDAFEGIVCHYVEQYAPRTFTLGDCGAQFPGFLSKHPFAEFLPFISDLSKAEWHLYEAFFWDEAPLQNPKQLQALSIQDWETTKLRLAPSAVLLRSKWPISKLLLSTSMEFPVARDSTCVIYRHRTQGPSTTPVELNEYRLLSLFPCTLGQFITSWGNRPAPLSDWFQKWLECGILAPILPASHPITKRPSNPLR